jgi:hypothetical protein
MFSLENRLVQNAGYSTTCERKYQTLHVEAWGVRLSQAGMEDSSMLVREFDGSER